MLIGGPDDGVITPWQSRYVLYWYSLLATVSVIYSHFGFYDEKLNVQGYQKQEVRQKHCFVLALIIVTFYVVLYQ